MRLRDKRVTTARPRRAIIATIAVLVCGCITFAAAAYTMSKQVSIVDGDTTVSCTTFASKVSDVLANQKIVLGEADETTPALDETIAHGGVIQIHRAKTISLVNGKEEPQTKLTAKGTVQQALEQLGFALNETMQLNVAPDSAISPDMTIQITYVAQETRTEEEPIAYQTVQKAAADMEKGQTKVAQEGENGIRENTYRITLQNGDEVSRELVSSAEKAKPVDRIVQYGTKAKPIAGKVASASTGSVSRGGDFRYKAVYTVKATAYCQGGYTASGRPAKPGVIAVDPKVIPLGSRVFVEAADGSWSYGNAIAADTGGAIKGNKIDLCMATERACTTFGVKQAKVYVLE